MRSLPPASAVLRRALLLWGLGHLSIGDRRGWLLLALQAVAVGGFVLLAVGLIDSSRWIALLPLLALLVLGWIGQAVHAHQRAVRLGAAPGGELQMAWLLPVVVVVFTAFWLVGGIHASPDSTVQRYVEAWRWSRPWVAASLFRQPVGEDVLAAEWRSQLEHVSVRVGEAAAAFGAQSGLESAQPFNALRVVELPDLRTAERAVYAIQITRRERIETTLFGLLPTATQMTVVVEQIGRVHLTAEPAQLPWWLPPGLLDARVWLIDRVEMPVVDIVGAS